MQSSQLVGATHNGSTSLPSLLTKSPLGSISVAVSPLKGPLQVPLNCDNPTDSEDEYNLAQEEVFFMFLCISEWVGG